MGILTFTSSCSLCPSHWWLVTKEDSVTSGRGPEHPASPQTPGQLLTPVSPRGEAFPRPGHEVSEGSSNCSLFPQLP